MTFHHDVLDFGLREGFAVSFVGTDGRIRRKAFATKAGLIDQGAAKVWLKQWARENGWNG